MSVAYEPIFQDNDDERRFQLTVAIALPGLLLLGAILSAMDVPPLYESSGPVPAEAEVVEFHLEDELEEIDLSELLPPDEPEAAEEVIEEVPPEEAPSLQNTGLLAMQNQLNSLTALGSEDRLADSGQDQAGDDLAMASPDILASALTSESGGVDTRGLGAGGNSAGVPSRTTQRVGSNAEAGPARVYTGARGSDAIQRVFDQNKGAINRLYERERRTQPGLQGKLVLELTIEPSGEVSKVRIISSDLKHPALEKRVVARVKQFRFPASNEGTVTRTYPIEFLPS